jgi:hypothetical protein
VAEDVRGGGLERARALVARGARACERGAERMREHAHDDAVLAREVVQLHGLGHAVRLLGRARGAREDVLVERRAVAQVQEWCALLDHAGLCARAC